VGHSKQAALVSSEALQVIAVDLIQPLPQFGGNHPRQRKPGCIEPGQRGGQ